MSMEVVLVCAAISKTMCDKKSSESISNSNHMLVKVEKGQEVSPDSNFKDELEQRQRAELARQKTVQYHFWWICM